jgi:YgiT-type zinc finger domain-containing protein
MQRVQEQLSRGKDVVLIPLKVLVCSNCGERYYDRRTMQHLGNIEEALKAGHLTLERAGEVLQVS